MFDTELLRRLDDMVDTPRPRHVTRLDSPQARAALAEAELILTGWGCEPLTEQDLAKAPRLKAVFHCAGTVKHLLPPAAWAAGDLVVTSAAAANAAPVAEYALAAILFSGKRVPAYAEHYRRRPGDWSVHGMLAVPSNYQRTVGVVGMSWTGRRVLELLRHHDFDVLVADPYATDQDAASYGATLVDVDELVARCDAVSIHAPALPETRHLLDRRRLAALPDGATVINTARGSLIDTAALTDECTSGRLYAILDVTEPEPLPADSPLYGCPNALLTPHVAGAMGAETRRLGALTVDEINRYLAGQPLRHQVSAAQLARIA
jgi:phosphoglycerate dehydrogenase-like enzyme